MGFVPIIDVRHAVLSLSYGKVLEAEILLFRYTQNKSPNFCIGVVIGKFKVVMICVQRPKYSGTSEIKDICGTR